MVSETSNATTVAGDRKIDRPLPRVQSVDALRGLAVAIVVSASVAVPFLRTLPDTTPSRILINQFSHSVWHGLTLLDFAQPLFLAIMGTAVVLSFMRRTRDGQSTAELLRHSLLRAVLLAVIGIVLDGWPAAPDHEVRLAGPLQQIAACYLVGAVLIHVTNWFWELVIIAVLLVNQTLLLEFLPSHAEGTGGYSITNNLGTMLDGRWLPGVKYFGTWDPYGYASLLPALALTVAGISVGRLLTTPQFSFEAKVFGLLVGGVLLVNNGFLVGDFIPINSYLATTPFVMIVLGAALLGHAACLFIAGGPSKHSRFLTPLAAIGRNSLIVIVAVHLLPMGSMESAFPTVIADWLGNALGLVVALLQLSLLGGLIYWLARKNSYLSI